MRPHNRPQAHPASKPDTGLRKPEVDSKSTSEWVWDAQRQSYRRWHENRWQWQDETENSKAALDCGYVGISYAWGHGQDCSRTGRAPFPIMGSHNNMLQDKSQQAREAIGIRHNSRLQFGIITHRNRCPEGFPNEESNFPKTPGDCKHRWYHEGESGSRDGDGPYVAWVDTCCIDCGGRIGSCCINQKSWIDRLWINQDTWLDASCIGQDERSARYDLANQFKTGHDLEAYHERRPESDYIAYLSNAGANARTGRSRRLGLAGLLFCCVLSSLVINNHHSVLAELAALTTDICCAGSLLSMSRLAKHILFVSLTHLNMLLN